MGRWSVGCMTDRDKWKFNFQNENFKETIKKIPNAGLLSLLYKRIISVFLFEKCIEKSFFVLKIIFFWYIFESHDYSTDCGRLQSICCIYYRRWTYFQNVKKVDSIYIFYEENMWSYIVNLIKIT